MAISEKAWQQNVVDLARMYGWLIYHTFDSRRSEPGFPDLVLVHPKRGVKFWELKTTTGELTTAQLKWGAAIMAAGGDWAVMRPDDLERVTRELAP